MEKYGVDEHSPAKQASERLTHCPECGQALKHHGDIVLCPTHGSKPFEDGRQK